MESSGTVLVASALVIGQQIVLVELRVFFYPNSHVIGFFSSEGSDSVFEEEKKLT